MFEMPEDFDLGNAKTLGFMLVKGLVENSEAKRNMGHEQQQSRNEAYDTLQEGRMR